MPRQRQTYVNGCPVPKSGTGRYKFNPLASEHFSTKFVGASYKDRIAR